MKKTLRKFEKQIWATGAVPQSFDEDAVATNTGRWLFRHWSQK